MKAVVWTAANADPHSRCSEGSSIDCVRWVRAGETGLSSSTNMAATSSKICSGGCVRAIGNDLCAFTVEMSYVIVKNYYYDEFCHNLAVLLVYLISRNDVFKVLFTLGQCIVDTDG